METITTPAERFAEDYLLVTLNDYETYRVVMDYAREAEGIASLSDKLRDEFEGYISEVAEREEEAGRELGASLIRELLIGYGCAPFDIIARRLLDDVKEEGR